MERVGTPAATGNSRRSVPGSLGNRGYREYNWDDALETRHEPDRFTQANKQAGCPLRLARFRERFDASIQDELWNGCSD